MLIKDNQTLPLQEIVTGDKICNCCAVLKIEQFWKTTLFRIFLSRGHMSIVNPFTRVFNSAGVPELQKEKYLEREIFKSF